MNFSLKINFTVVLIIINFVSLNGFAYTFYVETSEFNDDVYIIENVISDESTNESNKKSEELELIKENNSNSNSTKSPSIISERNKENIRDISDNFALQKLREMKIIKIKFLITVLIKLCLLKKYLMEL